MEAQAAATVSMDRAYSSEPFFGGTPTGWIVRTFENGKLTTWINFAEDQREEARNLAKQFRNAGYSWEWTSHEHYEIDNAEG